MKKTAKLKTAEPVPDWAAAITAAWQAALEADRALAAAFPPRSRWMFRGYPVVLGRVAPDYMLWATLERPEGEQLAVQFRVCPNELRPLPARRKPPGVAGGGPKG